MSVTTITSIVYSALLLWVAITIWKLIYQAGFLDYDDNYGSLITAFLLSVVSMAVILILWIKWRNVVKACKWQTILFLILASPVTVAVVSANYTWFFGVSLKT